MLASCSAAALEQALPIGIDRALSYPMRLYACQAVYIGWHQLGQLVEAKARAICASHRRWSSSADGRAAGCYAARQADSRNERNSCSIRSPIAQLLLATRMWRPARVGQRRGSSAAGGLAARTCRIPETNSGRGRQSYQHYSGSLCAAESRAKEPQFDTGEGFSRSRDSSISLTANFAA